MQFEPGIYEVVSDVHIRREPRIVEGVSNGKPFNNRVGLLKTGTMRAVYSVLTQTDNTAWGRVSSADSAGIAEWVCIKGLNRDYMKFIEPLKDHNESPVVNVAGLIEMYGFLKTLGYTGKPPV